MTEELTIKNVERNEENLHFPKVITKEIGEINLPVQAGKLFLKGENCFDWIGQKLKVEKKIGRKYIRYYLNLRNFGFDDYKEWKLKKIKKEIKGQKEK